jgi:hypothetical protein
VQLLHEHRCDSLGSSLATGSNRRRGATERGGSSPTVEVLVAVVVAAGVGEALQRHRKNEGA